METQSSHRTIFLFPLGTVLFPGGLLPLKLFEQRYLEMAKVCLRDNVPFGVCLIREGHEVGTPALSYSVGCLATIEQWDMPESNLFHILARGGERFRVVAADVAANGLISAKVECLPQVESGVPDPECAELLRRVIDEVGADHFPQPICLDDGAWVAYRLAEIMNFPMTTKQTLLESETVSKTLLELAGLEKRPSGEH